MVTTLDFGMCLNRQLVISRTKKSTSAQIALTTKHGDHWKIIATVISRVSKKVIPPRTIGSLSIQTYQQVSGSAEPPFKRPRQRERPWEHQRTTLITPIAPYPRRQRARPLLRYHVRQRLSFNF